MAKLQYAIDEHMAGPVARATHDLDANGASSNDDARTPALMPSGSANAESEKSYDGKADVVKRHLALSPTNSKAVKVRGLGQG